MPFRILKKSIFAGCSKTHRCKAPDVLRSEAYMQVRRSKPVPCLTRERMTRPPQYLGTIVKTRIEAFTLFTDCAA